MFIWFFFHILNRCDHRVVARMTVPAIGEADRRMPHDLREKHDVAAGLSRESTAVDYFGPDSPLPGRLQGLAPGEGSSFPYVGPFLEASLPPWRDCIDLGIRSGPSSTG